jgi:bis(5'-nucleosyl)-tetraphosphatase (symmetrical)
MTTYAIGDLQGCHTQLLALLKKIDTVAPDAQLIFLGDIINRGPDSLATLRHVRSLGARARIVLGNHDLNFLAVACGLRKPHRSDTLDDILAADDRDELIDWLRQQPLALMENNHLCVHAGVLPQWDARKTLALAGEVETALRSDGWQNFLREMYGNTPARWHDDLQGSERLRCIVNALTRLRYCDADGVMDFEHKEGAIDGTSDSGALPDGLLPWFEVPQRQIEATTVVFGHWSTLGLLLRADIIALDTGCVWGGKLSAIDLQDRNLLQVDCPQQQKPGKS